MIDIREFDVIRLRETIQTADNYQGGEVRRISAGSLGTVVEVFSDGGLEVEFMVREPQFDGGELVFAGIWHAVSLTLEQVEPA